jgi:EAL domain-containing protein (putative c-di-GMP-specific phosphodiesterase class I)
MSFQDFIMNENFHHLFQPIYDINHWTLLGNEGLLRTKEYSNPEHAFLEAIKTKQLYELDSRSIHKAVHTYNNAGFSRKDGYLFLNVFPSTLSDSRFTSLIYKIMNDKTLSSQQLVLEISEQEHILNVPDLKRVIYNFKNQGILLALDDIGSGNSQIKSIIELEPNFLKLDHYFTENIETCSKKQSFIEMLLNYSMKHQSKLILEGIESPQEMAMAKILGVSYGQGYALGKPGPLKKPVIVT